MNINLISFISEYNRAKMISIYEPLEVLKKLSERDGDELAIASLTYRLEILNFDENAFEKALANTNFNLEEKLKTVNGVEITTKDFLKIISMEIGKEVARYYDGEVEKI
ncbi:hypothetical protein GCM10023210_33100 [Chryseobacterium ginsengisoli]|uniref:Uncharacterized protein n=1 Tax=Chryseobacterium ginsengisoli TaxID=363853 RepID=A0ABP9MNH3_9FLAO